MGPRKMTPNRIARQSAMQNASAVPKDSPKTLWTTVELKLAGTLPLAMLCATTFTAAHVSELDRNAESYVMRRLKKKNGTRRSMRAPSEVARMAGTSASRILRSLFTLSPASAHRTRRYDRRDYGRVRNLVNEA